MELIPQTDTVSNLQSYPSKFFAKAQEEPLLILQNDKPVMMLVSPDRWNATTQRLRELEDRLTQERQLRISNQRYGHRLIDPTQGITQEEFERQLAKLGLT